MKDELHTLTRYILPLLVVIAVWANVRHAYGMTILPPHPLPYTPRCDAPVQIGNAAFNKVTCWFYGPPYTPAAATWEIPVTMITPRPMTGRYPVVVLRHGYAGFPITCNNDNHSRANTIVMKVCAPYYPDQRLYGTNPLLMSWGGPFQGGNPEGFQAAEMLETLWGMYPNNIDYGAGVTYEGTSEGGTGGILQSMITPIFMQSQITVVDATLPHTLAVKNVTDPAVFKAWGNFDLSLMDFRVQAATGKLNNIYYRIRGATNDSLGIVDLDFFRLCDAWRIGGYGTWDRGGHSHTGEAGVNLPRGLYNEGQAPIRRDKPLPVFSNSTANYWGERGHYNLGLSAQTKLQTETRSEYEIRYKRHTNLGGGIPDQPEQVTFNVTLRRTRLEQGTYNYSINGQSGTAQVTNGTLTIEGISLQSSESYSTLTVMRD